VSILIVVDSCATVNSSVIGLVRKLFGEVIAKVLEIVQHLLESAVVLEAGRNGLMYISLVLPEGGREVSGGGGREVGSGSKDSTEVESVLAGLVRLGDGEVVTVVLEMGRNGLMYIFLEVGGRDVSGIGGGEVESGCIEMSLLVLGS